jgi:hypothetical protein
MSADGTYHFVYSGDVGLGMGVFTIRDNVLKGTDIFVPAGAPLCRAARRKNCLIREALPRSPG